jgi:mRNA interferase RelE/StbE
MAKYNVLYTEAFYESIKSIPKKDRERILKRTRALADDPRPFGSQKLSGFEQYRIRQGDYRILYTIQDDELIVIVVNAGHRRDIYDR